LSKTSAASKGGPLRVAVVDDSSFVRKAIERMFRSEPRVEIVGLAATGEELLAKLEEWQPEAITLDLSMPGMGGLRTLDVVMARRPTAVIILSTSSSQDAPLTIEALHRGAMDFIDKTRYSLVDFEALRQVILEKLLSVRSVSLPVPREKALRGKSGAVGEKKLPSRRAKAPKKKLEKRPEKPRQGSRDGARRSRHFDVLVIGASTGGPPTIQRLLEDLGPSVPVPVVIVQHMPKGFTSAFAERLNSHLPLQVREAHDGEALLPSTIYIAPAGMQLRLRREARRDQEDEYSVALGEGPSTERHKPSVDVLFESAAATAGRRTLAVLLTGMGSDGARGMAQIHSAGGYTVAQNAETCVVHGMPRAAERLGAVRESRASTDLGRRLLELIEKK